MVQIPGQPPKPILWVDGEVEFLNAHIRYLERRGFAVEKASTLAIAMDMLRGCPYDLVLLDEQTLGKEGASTLHRIRAACPDRVPLLLVTKADEERAATSDRGRDVDGFVGKPVNPVQLHTACRAALLAKVDRTDLVTSAYVRVRQEIKSSLLATPSPMGWEKIHFQISKWDITSDQSSDAGLRDTHGRHRRDLGKAFLSYLEDHYSGWVGKKGGNPDLHTRTVRRKLLPVLQRRVPAALVVLSGLRFDQWLVLQKQVEAWFKVENAAAWALLPTEANFCRAALFSGDLPRDVSLDHPMLWARLKGEIPVDEEGAEGSSTPDSSDDTDSGDDSIVCMRELLRIQLRKLNAGIDDPRFFHVRNPKESLQLAEALVADAAAPLVVVVVEMQELLRPLRPDACVPLEPGMSEAQVRAAADEAFRICGLAAAMQVLARQGRTVVLTADHGSVRADKPAEVFCQEEQSDHPRVKIGPNISCDERQALFIEAPERFGLPGVAGDIAYAIAKDRFYFAYPNKFQYFVTPYKDQMVSGGISPEEVIVPLATLTPLLPVAKK
jgi:CheY-like chemotaxis protein